MKLDLKWWIGNDAHPEAELQIRHLPVALEHQLGLERPHQWALLNRLYVAPGCRLAGYGTQLVQQAIKAADGLRLTLVVRPLPHGEGAIMIADKLREWYGRFGFDFYQGDPNLMVRQWRR